MRQAGGEWRPVIKHKFAFGRRFFQGFFENFIFLPELQYLLLPFRDFTFNGFFLFHSSKYTTKSHLFESFDAEEIKAVFHGLGKSDGQSDFIWREWVAFINNFFLGI